MNYLNSRKPIEHKLSSFQSNIEGHIQGHIKIKFNNNKYYDVKENEYVKIEFKNGLQIVKSNQYKEYQFIENGDWYLMDSNSELLK